MTECERAKNWLSENWKGSFCWDDVRSLMQFMREERARGIEEFVNEYEAHKLSWGGPVKSLLQFGREYLISKLRGEGRDE